MNVLTKIAQYYTVKLLFLAYLIHPKTKGARKIHASVLRPLLVRAQQAQKPSSSTPPTTKPSSGSNLSSPSTNGGAGVDQPLSRTSGFSSTQAGVPTGYSTSQFAGQGQSVGSGLSGSGGQIHLPSGGGTGVGQEVPKY
jgi:hypothetical protein